MKIIIHGTYGGYKILYPPTESTVIVNDVRSEAATEHCIGVSFYSVAYNGSVVEYTKFVGVRDQKRSNAAGNIAVTLSCADGKKLSGHDVVGILDNLTDEICKECVHDNYFDSIPDSWGFVDNYLNKSYITTDIIPNKVNTNTKSCAYLYYSDKVELENLMNRPDKETYGKYRQVFMIDKVHKGAKTNPVDFYLGKIDQDANLTNRYRISYHEADTNISVIQDGKVVENNSTIIMDGMLSVEYSKDYHIPYTVNIDLGAPENSSQYVNVDHIGQIVYIKPVEYLEPLKKSIHFIVKNEMGDTMESASITCRNDDDYSKFPDNNVISFTGNDLGARWHVSAKTIDGLESGDMVIIPANLNIDEYILTVAKNTLVKLTATCDNYDITSVTIFTATSEKFETKKGDNLVFKGAEITAKWKITAENNKCLSKSLDITPKDHENKTISFEMRKRVSNNNGGSNNNGNETKPKPPIKLIAIIATAVIVVGLAIVFIVNGKNKKKESLKQQAVNLEIRIKKNVHKSIINNDSLQQLLDALKNEELKKYNPNLSTYNYKQTIDDVRCLYMYIKDSSKTSYKNDKIAEHSCFFEKVKNTDIDIIKKVNAQYVKADTIDIDDVCGFVDAYKALKIIEVYARQNQSRQIQQSVKNNKITEVQQIEIKQDWTELKQLQQDVLTKVNNLKVQTGGGSGTTTQPAESQITKYLKNGETINGDIVYKKEKLNNFKTTDSSITQEEIIAIDKLLKWFGSDINIRNYSGYIDELANDNILKNSKFYNNVKNADFKVINDIVGNKEIKFKKI